MEFVIWEFFVWCHADLPKSKRQSARALRAFCRARATRAHHIWWVADFFFSLSCLSERLSPHQPPHPAKPQEVCMSTADGDSNRKDDAFTMAGESNR